MVYIKYEVVPPGGVFRSHSYINISEDTTCVDVDALNSPLGGAMDSEAMPSQ